jgi:proteasome lid subunit RPN8/RPN11
MFRIFVLAEAYGKMLRMLDLMDKEIGALMLGRIHNGDAYVEDVVITKQGVTGASVEFDEEGIDLATMRAMEQGKVVIGWFHSHVNMKAFWSGTDMKTINDLIAHTEDYLVSIVSNKKYEHVGRIDYYGQSTFGRERQFVDNIPVIPVLNDPAEYDAEIKAAIAENVTEKYIYYSKGKYGKNKGSKTHTVIHGNQSVFDDNGKYRGYRKDEYVDDEDELGVTYQLTDEEMDDILEELKQEQLEAKMDKTAMQFTEDDAEVAWKEIDRLMLLGMSEEQAKALVLG